LKVTEGAEREPNGSQRVGKSLMSEDFYRVPVL